MVSTECLASVDICMLRVAGLSSTGAPQSGAHGYITDELETAKLGTTSDTINEQIRRNGCGRITTRIPQQVSVKGSSFSVDLTKWERHLIRLLCGGTVLTSTVSVGYKAPALDDGPANPVCIELWSKAWDGSGQAVTALSTPNASWHCWVLPFVQCSLSEFTLANGDTIFTVTGEGSENPNITINGPWNDWPGFASSQGGFNTAFGEYDSIVLPTAACGLTTVPSGS